MDNIDPIVSEWIKKLGLQEEPIEITPYEDKRNTILHYDPRKQAWFIKYPKVMGSFMAIHKLGYLWLYRKMGVMEEKRSWLLQSEEYSYCESIVLDTILHYKFMEMDPKYRHLWYQTHTYNNSKLMNLEELDFSELVYGYLWYYVQYYFLYSPAYQERYERSMISRLKRFHEVIQSYTNNKYPFSKLHELLDSFQSLLNAQNYSEIEGYISNLLPFFFLLSSW